MMLCHDQHPRWALAILCTGLAVSALLGCGSSQAKPQGQKEAAQALPPLPNSPLAAVLPAEGDSALAVDLQALRGSPAMDMVERALSQSCFAATDAQSLFLNIESFAISNGGTGDTVFAIAVAGKPSQVSSERVLTALGRFGFGLGGAPTDAGTVGRLKAKALGSLRAADIAEGLVLVADQKTFAKLAASYDDPQRQAATPPSELQTGEGQLHVWTQNGREWLEPMGLVPNDIIAPLSAAPVALSFRSDADGFHVQLRAQLRDEGTAKALMQRVQHRLSSASLVFRLMGLPDLSRRLEGQQDGVVVIYRLHLTRDESARLLTLGQMETQNRLQAHCDAAATASAASARNL